jgi:hypothetical protein
MGYVQSFQNFCVQLKKQICLFKLRIRTPLRHFRSVTLSIISQQLFYANKINYMHIKRFDYEPNFISKKLSESLVINNYINHDLVSVKDYDWNHPVQVYEKHSL